MSYKVINKFIDKTDNGTLYEVGDDYPKGDHQPTKKRIDELTKIHKKYNRAFIKAVESKEKEVKKQTKKPSSKK